MIFIRFFHSAILNNLILFLNNLSTSFSQNSFVFVIYSQCYCSLHENKFCFYHQPSSYQKKFLNTADAQISYIYLTQCYFFTQFFFTKCICVLLTPLLHSVVHSRSPVHSKIHIRGCEPCMRT